VLIRVINYIIKQIKVMRIQAPVGNIRPWLTSGKIYEAFNIEPEVSTKLGRSFNVIDDIGTKIFTNEKGSDHLNGMDWIILDIFPTGVKAAIESIMNSAYIQSFDIDDRQSMRELLERELIKL